MRSVPAEIIVLYNRPKKWSFALNFLPNTTRIAAVVWKVIITTNFQSSSKHAAFHRCG